MKDADFERTGGWVLSKKNRSGGYDEFSREILRSGIPWCGHLRACVRIKRSARKRATTLMT